MHTRQKNPTSRVLAAILIIVGLLWMAQGLGYIRGGVMSGHLIWFYIGLASLLAGAILGFLYARTSRS